MASSKVMASPRSSVLSPKSSSGSSKPKPQPTPANSVSDHPMTVEDFLRNVSAAGEPTLLDASAAIEPAGVNNSSNASKTVDEVWREIVSGESNNRRKECKEEAPDAIMTLEDFLLANTGAGAAAAEDDEEEEEEVDVKNLAFATPPLTERLSGGVFAFDAASRSQFLALDNVEGSVVGFGNGVEVVGGRRKRGTGALEPLDKAAQQRQRRMIKNRESAARSRERKQAYQVELESLAVRLEEENEQLLKDKAERTKERFKQLMEKIIPVEEKRRPPRVLRRVHSFQW